MDERKLSFRYAMLIGIAVAFAGIVPPTAAANGAPSITCLEPASGPAGAAYPIQVTVFGTGFTPADNTVRFGPVEIPALVSSHGGTTLVFYAPKVLNQHTEAPPLVLPPGAYSVTVSNANGVSNALSFTLTQHP